MKFIVAIDGPAAAGKGTISKAVAAHFGFRHLDTGLLYRAVGRLVLQGRDPLYAARNLAPDDLTCPDLRGEEVASAASRVAAMPEVRSALVKFQREFAQGDGGAVLDGRDIGTVICPDADVKLYITASPDIRAGRRHAELIASGKQADLDAVLADIRARDHRDQNRSDAPLKPADDALLIDTSELSIDAAVAEAVTNIKRIIEGRQ